MTAREELDALIEDTIQVAIERAVAAIDRGDLEHAEACLRAAFQARDVRDACPTCGQVPAARPEGDT